MFITYWYHIHSYHIIIHFNKVKKTEDNFPSPTDLDLAYEDILCSIDFDFL